MKLGFYTTLCLLIFLATVVAEPLVSAPPGNYPVPAERVSDPGQFMSVPGRANLQDSLKSFAKDQDIQIYVVILKDESVEEANKLCDLWQKQWIPKGFGGIFVYSVKEKKYCFTATPDTLELFGSGKLETLFQSAVQNPPVPEYLDVIISVPIYRVVSQLAEIQRQKNGLNALASESQAARWEIIAGIAGAIAVIGWILCFVIYVKGASQRSGSINIPPPGMAYRNPPRRNRSGRRNRSADESRDDDDGGKKRRDRF